MDRDTDSGMSPVIPDDMLMDAEAAVEAALATGDNTLLNAVGRRIMMRSEQNKVWALIRAGWTFESEMNGHELYPFAWSWRRPPKRAGKPGRRFASTGQAYNAMMREREEQ
jgi:hypothetical protein